MDTNFDLVFEYFQGLAIRDKAQRFVFTYGMNQYFSERLGGKFTTPVIVTVYPKVHK